MAETDFSKSPLITPERLASDREACFSILADWATQGTLAAPDLPLEVDVFVCRIGGEQEMPLTLHVVAAAITMELTRYGNSIKSNRNNRTKEAGARFYAKLGFADTDQDSMPLWRIIKAAGPHQAVFSGEDASDLRADNLEIRGGGKATKDAREVAVRHAAERARKAGADVDAYVRNLWRLFALHDELHGGPSAY